MCRYSDEKFILGEVIVPDWWAITNHTPGLLAFGIVALLPIAVMPLWQWRRRG